MEVNHIIQLTEQAQEDWIGCVMIISEVKSWGVQAYMKMPGRGDVYLRVPFGQFEIVGQAVLVN
jgi:hypothetical protein